LLAVAAAVAVEFLKVLEEVVVVVVQLCHTLRLLQVLQQLQLELWDRAVGLLRMAQRAGQQLFPMVHFLCLPLAVLGVATATSDLVV
jgi:hypothetical protein